MKLITAGLVMVFPLLLCAQQFQCVEKQIDDKLCPEIEFEYFGKTGNFKELLEYTAQFFPELDGSKIEVRRKKITTMMAARPKRNFLFLGRDNRTYVLLITNKGSMNADSVYNELSSCAIIGVLGHELSHIVTYTEKSGSELVFFGIRYFFNRKKIEAETDLIAIEHGFGQGLVEYTHTIHHSPFVNKKYLQRKKKYYLSANELETRHNNNL